MLRTRKFRDASVGSFSQPQRHIVRALAVSLLIPLILVLEACGGGGGASSLSSTSSSSSSSTSCSGSSSSSSSSSASNVATVVIDGAPCLSLPFAAINTLYTSVTVCLPGAPANSTTQCQTIDHVEVDTGSYGLRLFGAAGSGKLTLSLPHLTDTQGHTVTECAQFADGYAWGPVATADVYIAGEVAPGVSVHLIGDSGFPNSSAPTSCTSGLTAENDVNSFGANGIIGIGPFVEDCGPACGPPAATAASGFYYSCPSPPSSTTCAVTGVVTTSQVSNPIAYFSSGNNNGSIIVLQAVNSNGAATLTGQLIFGINTAANNTLGASATVVNLDTDGTANSTSMPGDLTTNFTSFNNQALIGSYIDSGSNAYFFNDTNLVQCTASSESGFYCPATPQVLSATMQSQDAAGYTVGNPTAAISINVASADTLFNHSNNLAFNNLAGSLLSGQGSGIFDWGLPFFFGRSVYTGIFPKAIPSSGGVSANTPFFGFQ